jgi:hypothetical protein
MSGVSVEGSCNVESVAGGGVAVYTFVVRNDGSVSKVVTVASALLSPGVASSAFATVSTGGATDPADGNTTISHSLTMPAASTVTYTVTATAAAVATSRGTISQSVAFGVNDTDKYLTVVAGPPVRVDRTREELRVPSRLDGNSVNYDEIVYALLGGANRDRVQTLCDYLEAGRDLTDIFVLIDAIDADADIGATWAVRAKNPNFA